MKYIFALAWAIHINSACSVTSVFLIVYQVILKTPCRIRDAPICGILPVRPSKFHCVICTIPHLFTGLNAAVLHSGSKPVVSYGLRKWSKHIYSPNLQEHLFCLRFILCCFLSTQYVYLASGKWRLQPTYYGVICEWGLRLVLKHLSISPPTQTQLQFISFHCVFTSSYSWDRQLLCSSGLIIYGREGVGSVPALVCHSLYGCGDLHVISTANLCCWGQGSPDAVWPLFYKQDSLRPLGSSSFF